MGPLGAFSWLPLPLPAGFQDPGEAEPWDHPAPGARQGAIPGFGGKRKSPVWGIKTFQAKRGSPERGNFGESSGFGCQPLPARGGSAGAAPPGRLPGPGRVGIGISRSQSSSGFLVLLQMERGGWWEGREGTPNPRDSRIGMAVGGQFPGLGSCCAPLDPKSQRFWDWDRCGMWIFQGWRLLCLPGSQIPGILGSGLLWEGNPQCWGIPVPLWIPNPRNSGIETAARGGFPGWGAPASPPGPLRSLNMQQLLGSSEPLTDKNGAEMSPLSLPGRVPSVSKQENPASPGQGHSARVPPPCHPLRATRISIKADPQPAAHQPLQPVLPGNRGVGTAGCPCEWWQGRDTHPLENSSPLLGKRSRRRGQGLFRD